MNEPTEREGLSIPADLEEEERTTEERLEELELAIQAIAGRVGDLHGNIDALGDRIRDTSTFMVRVGPALEKLNDRLKELEGPFSAGSKQTSRARIEFLERRVDKLAELELLRARGAEGPDGFELVDFFGSSLEELEKLKREEPPEPPPHERQGSAYDSGAVGHELQGRATREGPPEPPPEEET